MEALFLISGVIWAIISVAVLIKIFQMAADVRKLKNHFIGRIGSDTMTIGADEEIRGSVRNCGVTYSVKNGSTRFSDGKVGFIKYLPDGKCAVSINGEDAVFEDVYYAAEALYEQLRD